MLRSHRFPKAFTQIELLIAVAILAILGALALVSLSMSRINARDTRRKSDVAGYTQSLDNYRVAAGSVFVKNGANCTATVFTDCTGAEGLSYGRLNFKGTGEAAAYPGSVTIAQVLKSLGYSSTVALDPLTKQENIAGSRDYVLVRCDADASQATGRNDTLFSVWTVLENAPTVVETDNTVNYCGGSFSRTRTTSTEIAADFNTAAMANIPLADPVNKPAISATFEMQNRYFAKGNGRSPQAIVYSAGSTTAGATGGGGGGGGGGGAPVPRFQSFMLGRP